MKTHWIASHVKSEIITRWSLLMGDHERIKEEGEER